jgi:hypothetical protein
VPWTKKQARYLLSKVSPLSDKEKSKMKSELHENPDLIREKRIRKSAGKLLRGK